jgi:hypothetical protein
MCLAPFPENPLGRSHPSHINPTCIFYRSNPEFYQFHEHCLLCLGNLFSYSLKSIVNREHIRFDWLRFGCVAVELFFGSNTVVVRIAELIIQRLLVKIRQGKYGG